MNIIFNLKIWVFTSYHIQIKIVNQTKKLKTAQNRIILDVYSSVKTTLIGQILN